MQLGSHRAIPEKFHGSSFIKDACYTKKMVFQSKAIKVSASESQTSQTERERDAPDPHKTRRNESLQHTIHNLVSMIDPTFNSHSDCQSMPLCSTAQCYIVHIVRTGVTPTLLNLPLSALLILSEADEVLYDSLGLSNNEIINIVPKLCEIICVGKCGDTKSWMQSEIDQLLLQKVTESAQWSSEEVNN